MFEGLIVHFSQQYLLALELGNEWSQRRRLPYQVLQSLDDGPDGEWFHCSFVAIFTLWTHGDVAIELGEEQLETVRDDLLYKDEELSFRTVVGYFQQLGLFVAR